MSNDQLKILFSSKSDIWETPIKLFDQLNSEFHFTMDACAIKENAKCEKYISPKEDGLITSWEGVVWCNPPYGRTISNWVKRAYQYSFIGVTTVMLLPARTDTKWFHEYIYKKNNIEIRFIKGRLRFGNSINYAPFPSMIVIFNSNI